MRDIEEIRQRCHITVDGHWIWKGALRPNGRPNIYAPDYTRRDGALATQHGPRAVWHCITEKAIPEGYRVFGCEEESACCNPAHTKCMPMSVFGEKQRKSGRLKGQTTRILANRATGRLRSKITPEIRAHIDANPDKTISALARELGVSRTFVWKHRTQRAGGMFSGLLMGVR